MDVKDMKTREARSLPGGVHIFETRMTKGITFQTIVLSDPTYF